MKNLDSAKIATAYVDSLWNSLRQLREPSGMCVGREGSDEDAACNSVASEWQIYLTETLHPGDPRCYSKMFVEAKKKEVHGLEKRGTWRIANCNSLPVNANVLGGKFVLTLKNANTLHEEAKDRYVAQGHRDVEKHFLVQNVTALGQSSIKMMLSVASMFRFRVYSLDICQAYLQSESQLMRKVFIKPKIKDRKFFGVQDDEVLELLLPLYGMSDSGDYWLTTVDKHAKNYLGLKSTAGDPSLYFYKPNSKTEGVMGI